MIENIRQELQCYTSNWCLQNKVCDSFLSMLLNDEMWWEIKFRWNKKDYEANDLLMDDDENATVLI